ncbi:golgin subfamily A member 4 isoform X2 [Cololabis saira]|uniref:golgin subfamily A member 4 isoform X2 n=1 Tax=Cololabis saira TaxID=129043 RepID=UPI002AD5A964|nr:golgin subfamily A member 4 isoform X2 [Cololabis saira]
MFKKLKQRINEEQSPQRNAQSPQQAQMGSGDRRSSQTPPFHHDETPAPSDREMLAGMIAEPAFLSEYTIFALDHSKRPKTAQVASVSVSKGPARSPRGSINGDGSASPQREESQSFAQKLQLKVPSVESLIRGGASRAESLFRSSSRESLVRSPSRESLTPLGENESSGIPTYDPPSDIESEAEEPPGSVEAFSKEQLLHRLTQVERSLGKYRGKYSELVTAYRTTQREKEKTQVILSQSQDKSLRRIGELREELQMDQQAKKHLQDEFDAALEEKDQMITVLQTQVALLKKRAKGVSDGSLAPEGEVSQTEVAEGSSSAMQSPSKEMELPEGEGNSDPTKLMEALQKRVKRQENLLQKCKEVMRTHKERSGQLSSENEALQEQLQERLQELEKMKELHTTEKTKLITQLRDAKNLIEQLEQDKGMVIAETKRQMHETLEMKEEEIAQLRSRLQQATTQKEELQEQKEKAEKSAFEELERALGVAQRAEEARKQLQVQLQVQLEEQVKEVEMAGEEERKNLQQELTRVKQEVVSIMKSSEETVTQLEKTHSEALAAKEEEIKERISKAVEQCKEQFSQLSKEREQQASLALEDAELQQTAVKTEADNRVKEIQMELEAARTRILELESSVKEDSQGESSLSHQLSSQLEELKNKHKEKITTLKEKHQEQLEKHKDTLTQQHNVALEEFKEKQGAEIETLLKDKELQFQTHIEDMNLKTLEKLDAKQAELEELSAELSEVLKGKQLLEDASRLAEQEHKESLGCMEKTLKQELNALKIVLSEKEKNIEQLILKEKTLREQSQSTSQDLQARIHEFEQLQQSLAQAQRENENLKESNAQSSKISDDLDQCKKDLMDLNHQLEEAKNDCHQKEKSHQEIEHQLQETKKQLLEKEKSFTADLNTHLEKQTRLEKQLVDEKAAHEKKLKTTLNEMEAKLKTQETKMEKFKHKAKEMHENYKKKLQQIEENMKKELAKKEMALQAKEQQVQEKIVEMAQKSSQGLSSAMSELQANHKEELEKLHTNQKHKVEELELRWREKLAQQEEELAEKHSGTLQEKGQELEEISQQFGRTRKENEQLLSDIKDLKEELAIRETTVQKLQEELNEAAMKLDSLSQAEALLKEQMEATERNLNQALNERNALQDQLNTAGEESKEKLRSLSEKLNETENELEALKTSRCRESEDLQSKFDETSIQLQAKEGAFQQQLIMVISKMDHCCKEVLSKIECASNELQERVESQVKELNLRLLSSQETVKHLKNIVLTKADRICTLEENLRQHTEENKNLCISLEQMTAQVNVHMERTEALTCEKESHSQSVSDQVQKIEELSEANRVLSQTLETNGLHITDLESIVTELKNQLASSIKEKEEAINQLKQQYEEERQQAVAQMKETIERLEQERKSALEQADALRNSQSEYENKAEARGTQDETAIKSLQARLEKLEREISEKNEALQRLTASIDNQSISKSEMDQVLSEKEQKVSDLTSELQSCIGRLGELQQQLALKTTECEQLTTDLKQHHSIRENEKREFVEQLQQIQMQRTQNGNLEQEMAEKLHSLEEDNQKCKNKLESQREEFERMKDEIIKNKEESLKAAEERLSAESARKVSELKKKAEQKISHIKKQLTAQLDEKEQMIKALQSNLEGNKGDEKQSNKQIETLEEKTKILEETLVKLQEEQEKQIEQILSSERLEKERSLEELKTMYEDKLMSVQRDAEQQVQLKETESAWHEIQAKLKEAEEQNGSLLAELKRLTEELREKDAQLHQLLATTEKLQEEVKVEHSSMQQTTSVMQNHSPVEGVDDDGSLQSLENKLSQIKNEKEKVQKDFTRLQKDMRVLRKEHEQDLEYMKKELLEENEKKLKLELEHVEMKHNSAMKQLLREFNTQMALKEKELDSTVKETIAKAQTVEEELLGSHRDEASQLRKVISQKDDDLHRTVQKYEQVIQTREEEMGQRVWQIQKQLEELQARCQGPSEVTSEDLPAQLAEKTTLLSEARLKEQEFMERINSLEDKLKCLHRSTVVTHLGSTFKDPGIDASDLVSEATEMEYLRKVLFEYMMGRETKTMAKVITSMLKFPPDQAQKVMDKEDTKTVHWLR